MLGGIDKFAYNLVLYAIVFGEKKKWNKEQLTY